MLEICRSRWSGCTSVIVSSKRNGLCVSEVTMSWQDGDVSAASENAANETTSPAAGAVAGALGQVSRVAGALVNRRVSAAGLGTGAGRRLRAGVLQVPG